MTRIVLWCWRDGGGGARMIGGGGEGMGEVVRVFWGSWGMSSGKRVRLL